MPCIYDNIKLDLLSTLRKTLTVSRSCDFSVGYLNLRGWKSIDDLVDRWSGSPGGQARILVGMQRLPQDDLRHLLRLRSEAAMDNQTAALLKRRLAEDFHQQLALGAPTNSDESALRLLAAQLASGKVVVKLFLRHQLHAKLYLCFRDDPINPIVGYVGSSNLTFSGLSWQGELNVDILDQDATTKLAQWFSDRWEDRWCINISEDLVRVIQESWAREDVVSPYHVYIKMAYHLAQEARAGLAEFRIPKEFRGRLFDFQVAAVKIAAHHLNKRGGVLIGDVVGLGKTIMAAAVAKIFQEDHGTETLIICPKNLVEMWEGYIAEYRLVARALSVTQVERDLPDLRRYRIVLIDESHAFRNREGKRYRAIQEYIHENESKCILLSATPYNKTYLDLSNQLRLFVRDDEELGARPERLIRELGEAEFVRRHQCGLRSIRAFDESPYVDDWRDLMRLYLVRRTRTFVKANYAATDGGTGRRYLTFSDGTRAYFPDRVPKTILYVSGKRDQYARLHSSKVVDAINSLALPRYGLGEYIASSQKSRPTPSEAKQLQNLSRVGQRLMGFCRTNLFKRLESSGPAFLLSVKRHVLRNFVYLHAISQGQPLPLGSHGGALLDGVVTEDDDAEAPGSAPTGSNQYRIESLVDEEDFRRRASEIYSASEKDEDRFVWLRSELFVEKLAADLMTDTASLLRILKDTGVWRPANDAKVSALYELVVNKHGTEKVLVFSQFADTVEYLERQLLDRGVANVASVTGRSKDPTTYARRFSPVASKATVDASEQIRVLVATDVMSEGHNLQDAAIVVNFDLPWAIIRLIQRAGRVDRIGQKAETIFCYSFLPADGVEDVIGLRARVRSRLDQNAELVGTDEAFFEDERARQDLVDLYHERSGILDDAPDAEVDLASYAYQVWKNAVERDPGLQRFIPALPQVGFSTKQHRSTPERPDGVLVYLRTAAGNDSLAWMSRTGEPVTESQFEILKAAECSPHAPALPRATNHHELVQTAITVVAADEQSVGGQLGRPSGARFRTYQRLKAVLKSSPAAGGTWPTELEKAVEELYRYPLRQATAETLSRQLRAGISDLKLADLVAALHEERRLCVVDEEEGNKDPQIICSLGLVSDAEPKS